MDTAARADRGHTDSPLPAEYHGYDDSPAPSPFRSLGLPTWLLPGLDRLGYDSPTAIQEQAIPELLAGRDVTGLAQTGTGKTAAFGLPLLAGIDSQRREVQALVLVPTRELAVQGASALSGFARDRRDITVTAIYGGASIGAQITSLRRGAQVVVGTPGRVMDLMDRGALDLRSLRFAVLDEADEMLQMGFAEDVDTILRDAPGERQTALFSATMPASIRAVAKAHLRSPVDVSVAASATPVDGIEQRYAVVPFRHKAEAVRRVLLTRTGGAAVVFVRTRSACDTVGAALINAGLKAAVISGDVSQRDREKTIDALRDGTLDVLVATDVAARGMDVPRIGLVVNFDAPRDPETYIHRIGRTGRAGRSGEALTFFTPKEAGRRKHIERATGHRLTEFTLPSLADMTTFRAERALDGARTRHAAGALGGHVEALRAAAERAEIPVVELAAALLATASGDDGSAPGHDEIADAGRDRKRAGRERGRDSQHERGTNKGRAARHTHTKSDRPSGSGVAYVVHVGRRHGVRPAGIVGAIAGEGNLPGSAIGRITIRDTHSIVEICQPVKAASLARISSATVSGQQLRIHRDHQGKRDHQSKGDYQGKRARHGAKKRGKPAASRP